MIIESIRKRRSHRSYRSKMVSDEDVQEIIKAAQFAPTAMGNGAVEFVVVKDQKIKDAIFEAVGQEFIRQAPVLIVPAISVEKSVLPVQDLSIASEHMMLQATELGLGTVWKNLTPEWMEKVRDILEIPKEYALISIVPVGYVLDEVPEHSDSEFSQDKIHWEKWRHR